MDSTLLQPEYAGRLPEGSSYPFPFQRFSQRHTRLAFATYLAERRRTTMPSAYTRPALEQALGAINAAYGFKMQPGLAKFRGAVDFALTLARDRYGHTFRLAGHSDVLEALADICKEIKDANPRPVPSGKDAKTRIERLDAILVEIALSAPERLEELADLKELQAQHKKQLVTLLCEAAYNAANARRDRPKPHPTPIPNGTPYNQDDRARLRF